MMRDRRGTEMKKAQGKAKQHATMTTAITTRWRIREKEPGRRLGPRQLPTDVSAVVWFNSKDRLSLHLSESVSSKLVALV